MEKSLVRDVINSMKPAFSFSSRSEERGMVNLRDNENPFGGQQIVTLRMSIQHSPAIILTHWQR
ncbi:hypothetical protein [Dickeya oryzae]|uniref:hypothetical protein n=1 Tax=Dickeya oryzae TaxID=1240404 RepID=UPI00039CBCE9|nr:hypothetical protein [Dickeya oryzae]